jgi:biopolymer transport protein ExbD
MQAFLLLDLTSEDKPASYQQADVNLVKVNFPNVALLDLDATSDELLVHYAKRMMQEAAQLVVCIKADENTSFRSLTPLLESLLQENEQQLVLLRGESHRLQRMIEARPYVKFKKVDSTSDVIAELEQFYT